MNLKGSIMQDKANSVFVFEVRSLHYLLQAMIILFSVPSWFIFYIALQILSIFSTDSYTDVIASIWTLAVQFS